MTDQKQKQCPRCGELMEEGATGRLCSMCESAVNELRRLFTGYFEREAAAAEKAAASRAKERP